MKSIVIYISIFLCYVAGQNETAHVAGRNVTSRDNSIKRDGYDQDILELHKVFTKNEAIENAKYFADLIGKVVGVAAEKTPVVGDIYSTMVELVYEFSKKEEKDVFEKIEDKVKSAIRKEITNYHFDNMFGSKMLINAIVKEKILSKAQWFTIKSEKYKFLPQLYKSVEYTKKFYPEWKAYTLIFVAATVDMISKKELGKCEIVKEIKALKSEYENAIKALQLKRWQLLEGYDYYHNFKTDDALYYKDKFNKDTDICHGKSKSACEVKHSLSSTFRGIGNSVIEDAMDFINGFNEIAKSVDKGGKYCFNSSCECSKIELPAGSGGYIGWYPSSCMGVGKGSEKGTTCEFPCDTYGKDDSWCLIRGSNRDMILRNNNWMNCEKPDWNTCYKIPTPYLDDKA